METSTLVTLGMLALLIGYAVLIYNQLLSLEHTVGRAWNNIDILLRQRHDDLPGLIEICKQYMNEHETLETVMRARSAVADAGERGDMDTLGEAEYLLRVGLGQLFALAEACPGLKANQDFQHLQTRISTLENNIADRREFYNAAVNTNNVRIEQFPDLMIARIFGFGPARLLEFADAEKATVNPKAPFDT